jgi:hypothetical protein
MKASTSLVFGVTSTAGGPGNNQKSVDLRH